MKAKDHTGQRFGRLVAMKRNGHRGKDIVWKCKCDCGSVVDVIVSCLRNGHTTSCGCWRREMVHTIAMTHGATRSSDPIMKRCYAAWQTMKRRCYDSGFISFENYGARGITVCESWRESFEAFMTDMGLPPTARHSVDRKDNDGNYEPLNCRWATQREQNRNTRANIYLTINGVTRLLVEWAELAGLKYQCVRSRLRMGWTPEDAIAKPRRNTRWSLT